MRSVRTHVATTFRRALWLTALGAAGGGAFTWWRSRGAPATPPNPPEWPPLRAEPASTPSDSGTSTIIPNDPPSVTPTDADRPSAAAFVNALVDTPDARSTSDSGTWVEPSTDGSCPDGFPIKANDNSGIYHVPSGRFYGRTKAERCYATAEGAEADGYRAAKS